jgi:ABC-2 type transport system ATP-binding protein
VNEFIVETTDLTRRFANFTAVDKLTLGIRQGEIFGFLGANGAGKTTAIRMLCGLLLPTSGQGQVAGFDVVRESEKIKRNIGYMSQKFSLYPDLTGRENLNFYASAYDLDNNTRKQRIAELTERLSLGEFIDRISGKLPTGWRQRLALSAAVLHRPKILFLDEPTGGVDPVFRRKFWNLLYSLAEEGITIFVTTHYMDEAEYCDRISIMHAGKLVEVGKPFELVKKYNARNLEDMFIDLITPKVAADA